jgi:mono/diheme cytochrome c family protein
MTQPTSNMNFHRFGVRFAVTLHGGAPRKWFDRISNGVVGPPAMPAFKDTLAREQIWLTVTYLQSLDADVKEGM